MKSYKIIACQFIISLFFLLVCAQSFAATFTVDTTSDTVDANVNDGICADAAGDCSLRAAFQSANSLSGDDTISLPAGTFTLTIPSSEPDYGNAAIGDLDLTSNVTIDGAGRNLTIIDANSAYSIFTTYGGGTVYLNLSDLTIQEGNPYGLFLDNYDYLTVNNVRFRNNTESALYTAGLTEVTVEDSVFLTNGGTSNAGGAVSIANGIGLFTNSFFQGNTGADGGAISASGNLTLVGCSFTGNSTSGSGAALMYAAGSTYKNLSIDQSTFINNIGGTGSTSVGGALHIIAPETATISNSLFSGNSAPQIGGGAISYTSNGVDPSYLTLYNSTFTANSGYDGGAIRITAAQSFATISNCTFSDNTASHQGGAAFFQTDTVSITNSILANNSATSFGDDCYVTSGVTSLGYNLIETISDCGLTITPDDITGIDPDLSPLANNGGATFTMAISATSPAVDAGNPTGCKESPTATSAIVYDQRGSDYHRTIDGDGDGTPQCDIGAYEYVPTTENACGDGIDDDRDTFTDCADTDCAADCMDVDADGALAFEDCDDNDPIRYPSATDSCGDGIDQNCNGSDDCADVDADGATEATDCDDNDSDRYPGASDSCGDGIDQNCSGADDCFDNDGDGITELTDCNDGDDSIFPGAEEICGDAIDQDCDSQDLACAVIQTPDDTDTATDTGGDETSTNTSSDSSNDATNSPDPVTNSSGTSGTGGGGGAGGCSLNSNVSNRLHWDDVLILMFIGILLRSLHVGKTDGLQERS